MDEFPARSGLVLGAIPGDPMSRALKASEFLGVEMKHVARLGMLIAHHRRRRFKQGQTVESGAFEPATDGCFDRRRIAGLLPRAVARRRACGEQKDDRAALIGHFYGCSFGASEACMVGASNSPGRHPE